jgi:Flp pilus assembly pilin Flp
MIRTRRAQSAVEIAVLLAAVAAALIAMYTFIRSSASSRVKVGADVWGHGMNLDN